MLLHGYHGEAEDLRTAMVRLVHRSGHFECFHPVTGEGIGAPAVQLDRRPLLRRPLADRSVPAYARAA